MYTGCRPRDRPVAHAAAALARPIRALAFERKELAREGTNLRVDEDRGAERWKLLAGVVVVGAGEANDAANLELRLV